MLLGAPWERGEHAENNIGNLWKHLEEHDENGIEHPWEHVGNTLGTWLET